MADNKIIQFKRIPAATTALTKNFLITTIRNAFELYGDSQSDNVAYIHSCLIEHFGGNWLVLMNPKDNKTHNIHFNHNTLNGEPIFYEIIRENKYYLMAQYP